CGYSLPCNVGHDQPEHAGPKIEEIVIVAADRLSGPRYAGVPDGRKLRGVLRQHLLLDRHRQVQVIHHRVLLQLCRSSNGKIDTNAKDYWRRSRSNVSPTNPRHISSSVPSPHVTVLSGLLGLRGFDSELL